MFLFNIENQMLLAKGRKTVFNFANSNINKIAGAFSFSRKKVNINNTKAKAKRQEGVKINESNRNSKADRGIWYNRTKVDKTKINTDFFDIFD